MPILPAAAGWRDDSALSSGDAPTEIAEPAESVDLPTWAALESAAWAAWPALAERDHAGWRLRTAQGYTKRANSANAGPDAQALTPRTSTSSRPITRGRACPSSSG
jgi:hypothetical protein